MKRFELHYDYRRNESDDYLEWCVKSLLEKFGCKLVNKVDIYCKAVDPLIPDKDNYQPPVTCIYEAEFDDDKESSEDFALIRKIISYTFNELAWIDRVV